MKFRSIRFIFPFSRAAIIVLFLLNLSSVFSQQSLQNQNEIISQIPADSQINLKDIDTSLLSALILQKINAERAQRNLPELSPETTLQTIAAMHAAQMTKHGFTDHINRFDRQQRTLKDRIQQQGQFYSMYAENLALVYPFNLKNNAYSITEVNGTFDFEDENGQAVSPVTYDEMAQNVVSGWMSSTGHRQNILNKDYRLSGLAFEISFAYSSSSELPFFRFVHVFGRK